MAQGTNDLNYLLLNCSSRAKANSTCTSILICIVKSGSVNVWNLTVRQRTPAWSGSMGKLLGTLTTILMYMNLLGYSIGAPFLCSLLLTLLPNTWRHKALPQSPSLCLFCKIGIYSSWEFLPAADHGFHALLSSEVVLQWPSVHFRSRSIHLLCGSRSMNEAYRVRGRQLHEQEQHLVPFLQNEYLHLVSFLLLVAGWSGPQFQSSGPEYINAVYLSVPHASSTMVQNGSNQEIPKNIGN